MVKASRPERAGGPRRLLRSAWFVLPLVVVWAVPIAVLVLAGPAAQRAESSYVAAHEPTLVPVGSRTVAPMHETIVQVGFQQPGTVSVRRSGLVTAVSMKAGTELKAGTPLVAVDSVPVLAYPAAAPLFRDLKVGDAGEDVAALTAWLAKLKVLDSSAVGSRYDGRVVAAVKRLQTATLKVKATGQFSTQYVAFVPRTATVVKSVQVQVGQDVQPGTAVASVSGLPTSVVFLNPPDGKPLVLGSDQAPATKLTLHAGEATLKLASLTVPKESFADIHAFLAKAVTKGDLVQSSPADPGTGAATPATTELFSGAVVEEAAASGAGTVPATAVYTSPSGAACIFLAADAGYRTERLGTVALIPGQLGVVAVPDSLIGQQVVRNPTGLTAEVTSACG